MALQSNSTLSNSGSKLRPSVVCAVIYLAPFDAMAPNMKFDVKFLTIQLVRGIC
jgi:hypothetical protein